ncbi:MAG: c-type cytochrome biogenesis protein CcmI, partial [Alphaproteobacteria bacterium]|nr:c-type cytochrome biogenesis protein CcmI [Alphaproteobacteria bacterium]
MIVWLVFAGLALVVSAALALPMLCRSKAASTRADFDLEVFRAQLAELESDHVRGLLGIAELAAARREIERRMLGAAPDAEVAPDAEAAAGSHRLGLFLGVVAFVALQQAPAPEGLSAAGWRTTAVVALIAVWW